MASSKQWLAWTVHCVPVLYVHRRLRAAVLPERLDLVTGKCRNQVYKTVVTFWQKDQLGTGRRCVLGISVAGGKAYPETKPICDAPPIRKGHFDVAATA